jgi:hypothetical protein
LIQSASRIRIAGTEDSALVLTQVALNELHITPTSDGHKISDVKGNTVESPTFIVPVVQIGGAVFTQVPGRVDAHDPSYQSTHVGQEGYMPALARGDPLNIWPRLSCALLKKVLPW